MTTQATARRRGLAPRTLAILIIVAIMVLVVTLNILSNRSTSTITSADQTDLELVAVGQIVYQARCASCHGANLEGQSNWQQPLADGSMPAPPHDATGHTWHHNDRFLFETVKYGGQATSPSTRKNTMPAFKGILIDREIWAALAYIKSTWSPELIEQQKRGHN